MVSGDVVNTASASDRRAGRRHPRRRDDLPGHRRRGRVPRPSPGRGEGQARAGAGLGGVGLSEQAGRAATPLVGREPELIQLLDALARVREERARSSSRCRRARDRQDAARARARARDPGRPRIGDVAARPLPSLRRRRLVHALAKMARSAAGILTSDSHDEADAKLDARSTRSPAISTSAGSRPTCVRCVGLESEPPETGGPFAAWRRFFEALAERRPLVLVFEDLHWADPGVLDFVDHLVDWASGVPLFVLCTARPELLERRPGLGRRQTQRDHDHALAALERGDRKRRGSAARQVGAAAGSGGALLAQAGGNPLYAEEYARMLVDRGLLVRDNGSWRLAQPDLPLPESVQGTIAARVDALPAEEKAVLQEAAVVGKVFWLGVVTPGGDRA